MRQIVLKMSDNPIGADPLMGLYNAINLTYPDLGLTQDNSTVIKIQAAARREEPRRTRVLIQKGDTPAEQYDFFYDRFMITDYVENPFWTESEVTEVQGYTNSTELLAKIATKTSLNLTGDDFWIERASIDYTGGTVTPNWLMKSVASSVYFMGEYILWLHSGGDDPGPEPTTGLTWQLFPFVSVPFTITDEFSKKGNWYCPGWDVAIGRTLVLQPPPEGYTLTESWPGGVLLPGIQNSSFNVQPGMEWRLYNASGMDLIIAAAWYTNIYLDWNGVHHYSLEKAQLAKFICAKNDSNPQFSQIGMLKVYNQ